MEWISALLILLYILFILKQIISLKKYSLEEPITNQPEINFTLIVPFRNEEFRITDLLSSINLLEYDRSKIEVLFVNDHSTDNTSKIIKEKITFPFKIIDLENTLKGKKDAIKTGGKFAIYDWLVFTDADCVLQKNHLLILNNSIRKNNVDYVAGNLRLKENSGSIYSFEYFENILLQGFTASGFFQKNPTIVNGANWAIKKNLFNEVNFNKNEGPSGDDVFLLHRVKKSCNLTFEPQLVVATSHSKSLNELFSQKVRWASKSFNYFDKSTIWQGLAIGGGQLGFVLMLAFLLISKKISILAFLMLGIKLVTDWIFYYRTVKVLKYKPNFIGMIVNSFIYSFYSVAIAIVAPVIKFNWKGRSY